MRNLRLRCCQAHLTSLAAKCQGIFILAIVMVVALSGEMLAQQKHISIGNGEVTQVFVAPGKTLTISTNLRFSDLVVGSEQIADVVPISERSLYIQGVRSGFTNVSIYNNQKKLLGIIDVRVRLNFNELQQAIRSAVPSAQVTATNVNNRVRLSGLVKNAVDLRKVIEVAEQYSSEPVINSIRVRDAQQVLLKVRVLEVTRTAGRDLGINLSGVQAGNVKFVTGSSFQNTGAVVGGPSSLIPVYNAPSSSNGLPFGTLIGQLLEVAGVRVDILINALEAKGLGRRLANPSLIAMSGTEATFNVGGEVPISTVVTGDNGNVATQTSYRPFGVILRFRPVVLDKGLINLYVNPEVSEVDWANTVNGNPSFVTRSASTTVELRDGQSFAIAGLLQTTNAKNIRQVPWLGQVPILGTLFRSTHFQKMETDLVIVVTPRIVRPAAPDEPLNSPLDSARSSDDVELFLLGMLEVDKDMIRRFRDGKGIVGPYGHIIDLDFKDQLVVKK